MNHDTRSGEGRESLLFEGRILNLIVWSATESELALAEERIS